MTARSILTSGSIKEPHQLLSCQYDFYPKVLSAYYVCCIYLNALETAFTMKANTMSPDQTAPKGAA